MKWFGKYEERQVEYWKDLENTEEIVKRYEKYGRKVGWRVKWYGKYERKVIKSNSDKIWTTWKKSVKRYGKYGRKISWIVKWFGKYSWKLWHDRENMEEK